MNYLTSKTMNYKELYTDALNRAKESYKKSIEEGWTCDAQIYESIFPELAEFKSDRIMNKIKTAVSQTVWLDSDKNECYEWIESRKDIELIEERARIGGMNDVLYHPDKYGLQKESPNPKQDNDGIRLTNWKDIKTLCESFMDVGLNSNNPANSKELYREVIDEYIKRKSE